MSTTTIATGQELTTLINVFTVAPDDRQSANFHVSLDGTRVVNYAQWRSQEHLQAMLADPTAQEHMGAAAALATFGDNLYEVVSVHHA